MFLQRIPKKGIEARLILLAFGLGILAGCCPVIHNFNPESGNAGTEVTCNGERFEGTPAKNTVRFGGVTVPTGDIISATTTKIKAKVPTGATTGLISIKNQYCWGESKKNFIVPTTAKWTFMVYLDADNNLESFGIQDFLEMASVGSTAAVNILVQMDRGGYDNQYGAWTGTRRFLIQRNDTPSVAPLEDMGEQNMGDPTVLRDFVIWGVTHYPAEHYALVIWNHGGGWREQMERLLERSRSFRSLGRVNTAVARAVAWDDTNSDVLYERGSASLEGAKQESRAPSYCFRRRCRV
jgi:hypothetical protein